MCFVVVTCRSLLWTLLTLVSTLVIVASVITPQWLIGQARRENVRYGTTSPTETGDDDGVFRPTLGIYNRCTRLHMFNDYSTKNCAPYVTKFTMTDDEFPHVWKAVLILFCLSGLMLTFTVITAIVSLCFRSMCKKDIFTLTGLLQSLSGLLLILALVLYPAGWGSMRVQRVCGLESSLYYMGNCDLGWAFYSCIGGTVLVIICAMLSIQASAATSSRKVEEQIMQGRNPICVL
ncbi:LHFPL tetraspan subfamily member 2a protein-like [Tubulanus polymorphus]|uniref:LHFPL tetraspan subfamily member 2a protein-like n=1 Tax=Tubulanus polymorphus TaxID=672921 RepID=UPI003DA32323